MQTNKQSPVSDAQVNDIFGELFKGSKERSTKPNPWQDITEKIITDAEKRKRENGGAIPEDNDNWQPMTAAEIEDIMGPQRRALKYTRHLRRFGWFYSLRSSLGAALDSDFAFMVYAGVILLCLVLVGLGELALIGLGIYAIARFYAWVVSEEPTVEVEPVIVLPHRTSGAFGEGGFAYSGEFHARGLSIENQTDFAASIYLGRFVEMYGVNPPVETMTLGYKGDKHGITLAPTRSGKGTAAIIPTLLTNQQSTFVLDVKGENYFVTGKAREDMGHVVHVLNPFNVWGKRLGYIKPFTSHYNPLQLLRPSSSDFEQKIQSLAAAMIMQESNDPHWSNRAQALVSCLMAHVCSDPVELKAGNNHLARVREILGFPAEFLSEYLLTASLNPIPLVRNNAATFSGDSKEVQGVIATALGQLDFLNTTAISDFLKNSDFDFAELRQRKTTVYLIIPPNQLGDYRNFVRLMVQSLFNSLAVPPKGNEESVLLVLDEISKLGRMKTIEDQLSLIGGYHVRIWAIFQDLNQLKSIYSEAWESFFSNAGFIQVFTPSDMTTADYFSKRIGKTTTIINALNGGTSTNHSQSSGVSGASSSSATSSSQGWSQSPQAVDALSPQQLLGLKSDRGLVIIDGCPYPAVTTREPYFERWRHLNYLPNPMIDDEAAFIAGKEWHKTRVMAQTMDILKGRKN